MFGMFGSVRVTVFTKEFGDTVPSAVVRSPDGVDSAVVGFACGWVKVLVDVNSAFVVPFRFNTAFCSEHVYYSVHCLDFFEE
jgi:hypothetical protein